MSLERKEFDLLIVGSGISGFSAAIAAAEKGLDVAVISKEACFSECNTNYAQGGIVGIGENDSPELLERDIIEAGDGVNFKDAVRLLTREGPGMVEEFLVEKIGVSFCKNHDGKTDLTREAAHSVRRIYHVKDTTGDSIENELIRYVSGISGIHLFHSHIAIDLITNTHNSSDPQERYRRTRVIGAYILDQDTERVTIFFAPSVILATGGAGNLFLHTSNPPGATGDGVAMAYRIGADVINAEYVQFHPTVLYHRDVKRFLISEALRGEGARLLNTKGEYFMEKYDQDLKDLAPRDIVARAIYTEMELEASGYVKLDARPIRGINLEERFPGIFSQCRDVGIDIRKEPIPVVPAAHYFCGGVKVNLFGKTSIPGLYAVGETACTGVHGANRLASVSLLEALVWGTRAGAEAAASRAALPLRLKMSIPDWVEPEPEEVFDPLLISNDLLHIQTTMWNYSGIIRNRKRLLRASADLNYLSHRIERFYRDAKLTRGIVELRNSVLTATLILRAALANNSSQGCHYLE